MSAAKSSYKSTEQTRKGAVTTFGSRTDVGCVRDHNEDSLVVAPPLFAVADGMGGHAAGEVASEIAVNVLAELAPEHPDGDALERAVEEANRAIIRAASEGHGRAGMGTTMTAAMLEEERLVIAQVGDSRAYLLHQGELQQITRDHSLMADMIEAGQITPEEARTHPNRSIITRALGSEPNVRADIYELNVETGDRLLLCSDGLSSMLRDEDIEATLRRIQDPQRCATQLVNEAIAAGGYDNITVIVVDVVGLAEKQRKKSTIKSRLGAVLLALAVVAVVLAAGAGTAAYLNNSAYLIEEDGMVAIYQGVPGSVLGFSFSELVRVTDVAVDDLQPGLASRLEEGITVDNLEEAEELVADYEEYVASKADDEEDADADSDGDETDSASSTDDADSDDDSASAEDEADASAADDSATEDDSSAASSADAASSSDDSQE